MSALFTRTPGYHTQSQKMAIDSQLRSVPAIFTVPAPPADVANINDWDANGVLSSVYRNSLSSWLYGVWILLIHYTCPGFVARSVGCHNFKIFMPPFAKSRRFFKFN